MTTRTKRRKTRTLLGSLLLAGMAAGAGAGDAPAAARPATITGLVRTADGYALVGVEVLVRETGTVARTDAEGRFTVSDLTAGQYTLEVGPEGYVPQEQAVELRAGVMQGAVPFALEPVPRFLTQVVVTPSLYTLYGSRPEVATSLSREEVERLPHLAQDLFRAVRWLPGTSGEDFSALLNVRGGEVDETLVLVDGLEVQQAFHLAELFGGLQSVVDTEAIDGLEFMRGGFPVEYGNRMSGVIDIGSVASSPLRTVAGASTTHLGLLGTGPFASQRGQWLASVRRTNLDNVIRWVDPESGLEPLFYDVLGRVSYTLGQHSVLSANVLGAWDRTHFEEAAVDPAESSLMDATSSSGYAWLRFTTTPTPRLFMETVLSAGRVEREVSGGIDEVGQTGSVDDQRSSDVFGFKQDWRLDLADRHLLKWGFELRRVTGSYDHRSHTTVRDVLFTSGGDDLVTDRDHSLDPRGNVYAAYVADRWRLAEPLVAELGLRWDRQTYMSDSQLSPRLNLVYTLGDRTTLRGAWGLYHQAQQIHELQVSDGVSEFQPAQRSEQRLLSLEHQLPRGLGLRVDLYQKKLTDVLARFENLLNPIEIFPELEDDRVLVAPDDSDARGLEVVLRQDGGRRWSWWLAYAYARVQDEIDGEWVPRSRDQRHTGSFSLNYSLGDKWNFNLAGLYHTGWPVTPIFAELVPGPDDGMRVVPTLGPRNRDRYPDYLRFDFRASRVFQRGPGTWSVFLEVLNVLGRENLRGQKRLVDYEIEADGSVRLVPEYRSGFPLLPSLGVRWTF